MSNTPDRRTFIGRLAAGVAATLWLGPPKAAEANTTGTGPYIGEIMLVGFNYAPKGWALCNGQILSIAQNQALFSILGTTYGGNGITTFALPDLRDRVAIHKGQGSGLLPRAQGESGGEVNHTLTLAELPGHSHGVRVSSAAGDVVSPAGMFPAGVASGDPQFNTAADVAMSSSAIQGVGSGQPHPNLQPYLGLYYCIALVGIYPSQT